MPEGAKLNESRGEIVAELYMRTDLPPRLTLNAQTGKIHGTSSKPMQRKSYTVLEYPKGKSDCTVSLQVQMHTPPDPLEYDAVLHKGEIRAEVRARRLCCQ